MDGLFTPVTGLFVALLTLLLNVLYEQYIGSTKNEVGPESFQMSDYLKNKNASNFFNSDMPAIDRPTSLFVPVGNGVWLNQYDRISILSTLNHYCVKDITLNEEGFILPFLNSEALVPVPEKSVYLTQLINDAAGYPFKIILALRSTYQNYFGQEGEPYSILNVQNARVLLLEDERNRQLDSLIGELISLKYNFEGAVYVNNLAVTELYLENKIRSELHLPLKSLEISPMESLDYVSDQYNDLFNEPNFEEILPEKAFLNELKNDMEHKDKEDLWFDYEGMDPDFLKDDDQPDSDFGKNIDLADYMEYAPEPPQSPAQAFNFSNENSEFEYNEDIFRSIDEEFQSQVYRNGFNPAEFEEQLRISEALFEEIKKVPSSGSLVQVPTEPKPPIDENASLSERRKARMAAQKNRIPAGEAVDSGTDGENTTSSEAFTDSKPSSDAQLEDFSEDNVEYVNRPQDEDENPFEHLNLEDIDFDSLDLMDDLDNFDDFDDPDDFDLNLSDSKSDFSDEELRNLYEEIRSKNLFEEELEPHQAPIVLASDESSGNGNLYKKKNGAGTVRLLKRDSGEMLFENVKATMGTYSIRIYYSAIEWSTLELILNDSEPYVFDIHGAGNLETVNEAVLEMQLDREINRILVKNTSYQNVLIEKMELFYLKQNQNSDDSVA